MTVTTKRQTIVMVAWILGMAETGTIGTLALHGWQYFTAIFAGAILLNVCWLFMKWTEQP